MGRPYLTIERIVRIVFILAVVVAVFWVVGYLENVLLPFALACLIAYMLDPLVGLVMKWLHLKGRVFASLLTLIMVGAVIGGIMYFFVPMVVGELNQMGALLKEASKHGNSLTNLIPGLDNLVGRRFSFSHLEKMLQFRQLEQIVRSSASFVSQSLEIVMHTLEWLLTFIYVIFVLIDYPRLMSGFRRMVPPKSRPVVYKLCDDIKLNMNRYFRSQALIALCAAVFYCIGFSIVGIPLAIVLGVLVGILYMIPYFQYVTLIPVAMVCLVKSLDGGVSFFRLMGECGLVYVVSQCICDYVLTPKIMGKAMGLNPAIILLSLSVWGSILGLIGMIIALPLTTLMLAYYKQYIIDPGEKVPAEASDTQ